jgi:hypothetical protein
MSNGACPASCVLAAVVSLAGCAATPATRPSDPAVQHILLEATPLNAGRVGDIYLLRREHGTDIVLKVSGVTGWVTRPVHLYVQLHEGTCASPSPQPLLALTDRVLTRRDPDGFLTLRHMLPIALDTLGGSDLAIVVRSSPADANMPLFCGNLRSG